MVGGEIGRIEGKKRGNRRENRILDRLVRKENWEDFWWDPIIFSPSQTKFDLSIFVEKTNVKTRCNWHYKQNLILSFATCRTLQSRQTCMYVSHPFLFFGLITTYLPIVWLVEI